MYMLPALGDVVVRVEKEGFEPQEQRVRVEADSEVNFQLDPVIRPGGIAGRYQLSVVASSSCSLPSEVMRRNYTAMIQETPLGIGVVLTGAEFVVWGYAGFWGSVDGNVVRFVITDNFLDEYQLIERIDPGRDLAYSGKAEGTFADGSILATLSGTIAIHSASSWNILAQCTASDHRLEFAR
jgi:hypothetical protein